MAPLQQVVDRIIYQPAAKPALLLARAAFRRSNRHSTLLRKPESNSCERLSLLNVPECGKGGGGARGWGLRAPTDRLLLYYSIRCHYVFYKFCV